MKKKGDMKKKMGDMKKIDMKKLHDKKMMNGRTDENNYKNQSSKHPRVVEVSRGTVSCPPVYGGLREDYVRVKTLGIGEGVG